jgi:hypothetical protein
MAVRKRETFEPVTLGHIRGHGCGDILIYCGSIGCSHSATINADRMPNETVIRALGIWPGVRASPLIGVQRTARLRCVERPATVAGAFVRSEFCRTHLARKIGPRHPAN